jgi:16S rRNA (guanine527-N7)-methyltransferase
MTVSAGDAAGSSAGKAAVPGRLEVQAVCRALDLGVSAGQCDALLAYLGLLQRWNATYNLTAVRDPAAVFTQHLADCLAILPALRRHLAEFPAAKRVLDVGSGGGLPGVVIAVLQPQLQVLCVDAVGKKAAFVRQVAGNLSLSNLEALHSRAENLRIAQVDLIVSRAFSSLGDLTRLTRAQLAPEGVWMAMKGGVPDDEIADLPGDTEVFHVEQLRVPGLDARRCLVWMRRRGPV